MKSPSTLAAGFTLRILLCDACSLRVRRGHSTRLARRRIAPRHTLGSAKGPQRLLSLHADGLSGRMGEAGGGRAHANPRRGRHLARADAHAAERRGPRPRRARGLHNRKGLFRIHARFLRHGHAVSPAHGRQTSGGALPTRPLGGRALHGASRHGNEEGNRQRRRALHGKRTQHFPVARRPTRAHGHRRFRLRHAGKFRLAAVHSGICARLCQATSRDEHSRELGSLQSASRDARGKRHGLADVEFHPHRSTSSPRCPMSIRSGSGAPARAVAARRP